MEIEREIQGLGTHTVELWDVSGDQRYGIWIDFGTNKEEECMLLWDEMSDCLLCAAMKHAGRQFKKMLQELF